MILNKNDSYKVALYLVLWQYIDIEETSHKHKGVNTMAKTIIFSIALVVISLASIGCVSSSESVTVSNEPTPLTVDIHESATWGGCVDGSVVLNGKVYPTHDLTANIHVYGFTATKRVECDIVNGDEGYWTMGVDGIERFYSNKGTYTANR